MTLELPGWLVKKVDWVKEKVWRAIPEGVRFISAILLLGIVSYWVSTFFTERKFLSFYVASCVTLLVLFVIAFLRSPVWDGLRYTRRVKTVAPKKVS